MATYNITQDPNLAYLAGGAVATGGTGAKMAGAQVQKANVDKLYRLLCRAETYLLMQQTSYTVH